MPGPISMSSAAAWPSRRPDGASARRPARRVPQRGAGDRDRGGYDDCGRQVDDHVDDDEYGAHDGDQEAHGAGFGELGRAADGLGFPVLPKDQPVIADRGDQQCAGDGGRDQDDDVDDPIAGKGLAESGRKRQGEQEREQDLDAGLRDPYLLEEVAEVAVEPFVWCLDGAQLRRLRWADAQLRRDRRVL